MDSNFREKWRKTLYCGDLEPEHAPMALTDLTVEFFQGLAPYKLGHVDLHVASTIASQDSVSPSSMAMSMMYAKRLQHKQPDHVKKMSSSDLFFISMMMASKYLYDEGVDEEVFNGEWAETAGMDKDEVNRMEEEFLNAMARDWELFIKRDDFDQAMLSIERSIALREGLKRGWFTYTDFCLLWGDPSLKHIMPDVGIEWIKVLLVSSAAYFFAAMTMVGSTVLVTNASLAIASCGLLPVTLLPALRHVHVVSPPSISLSSLNQPAPVHSLVHLPTLDIPEPVAVLSNLRFPANETNHFEEDSETSSESTPSDHSELGVSIVNTILSQLMAVLTLKSHLVQFVQAVSDNYTSDRSRIYSRNAFLQNGACAHRWEDDLVHVVDGAKPELSDGSEMEKITTTLYDADHPEKILCCKYSTSTGDDNSGKSWLQSKQPYQSCKVPDRHFDHCKLIWQADVLHSDQSQFEILEHSSEVQQQQYCLIKRGVSMQKLFHDVTIGFITSMPPPVFAT